VRAIPLPPSRGTHISALLRVATGSGPRCSGDGLWTFDGKTWHTANVGLPAAARDITALAGNARTLFVGTRRAGLWEYDGKTWQQHLQPEEPAEHDAQALSRLCGLPFCQHAGRRPHGAYRVRLAASHRAGTLLGPPASDGDVSGQTLSPPFDRKVDCFDGKRWERDVFAGSRARMSPRSPPTRTASFSPSGADGAKGTAKRGNTALDLPELQGRTPTCLLPEGDTLWIGVQGRGLLKFQPSDGQTALA